MIYATTQRAILVVHACAKAGNGLKCWHRSLLILFSILGLPTLKVSHSPSYSVN